MKKDEILKIFYEDIVPFASKIGIIEIAGITYNVHFNSMIEAKTYIDDDSAPLLTINNVSIFNDTLLEYVLKEYDRITNSTFSEVFEQMERIEDRFKYIMAIAFCNAREEDFRNPVSYLRKRIDFIENNQLNNKYSDFKLMATLDDKEIEASSSLQIPSLESPYVFKSRIKYIESGEIRYYDLPNISYGISDKTAYVYSIQKSNTARESKKINRYLYKINKDVVDSDEFYEYNSKESNTDNFYPENITDVTHNSVLALTIFLGILKKEEISSIVVVDYLPLRYLAKREANITRLDLLKYFYGDDGFEDRIAKYDEIQDKNQNNITNKFIRTFNRVNYHLNNLDITSFPGDVDNSMHLLLNDNRKTSNNIINIVYNQIAFEDEKRK